MEIKFDCILVLLIFSLDVIKSQHITENSITQQFLQNLENSGYNSQARPDRGHGRPVQINCTMFILDIYKVDDKIKDFQAQLFFRQQWIDPRLRFEQKNYISKIILNEAKYVWKPDLHFSNGKQAFIHDGLTPNVFLRITNDGLVFLSQRLTVTFRCPMDFSKYPHDSHKCTITAESFGHTRNTLDISWGDKFPVGISKEINLPFHVKSIKEDRIIEYMSTGEYPTLNVEITFQRKVGFFVTRLYLPYIFLSALSWLSFWIPLKLVPHRLTLLLLILYMMVNIANDINDQAPRSSYTKASDVWIAVCQTLVVASLLEFIAVHMVEVSKGGSNEKLNKSDTEAINEIDTESKMNRSSNAGQSKISICDKIKNFQSNTVENISKFLFPILFLCFNVIYWFLY